MRIKKEKLAGKIFHSHMQKNLKDEYFMQLAIREAKMARGPKRFGAVVVKNNEVIARARNTTYETQNPITCAEVLAISKAAKKLRNRKLTGCTIYTTGESCLMCLGAILRARIRKVVVGFDHREYNKLDGRKDLNPWSKHSKEIIPPYVKIKTGVLREKCMSVLFNPRYEN